MPQQNNAGLIRLGLLALPLAGILTLVGQIASYGGTDPDVDPVGGAQSVSTTGFFVGQFVGSILAVMLVIFGVIALFAYLVNARGGRWAVGGLVLSIVGIALVLTAFGVITYAVPALGQAYLNGQQNAIELGDAIFNGPMGLLFIVVFFLYSAGFILFGVAVWRSGALPRWAGVLLAVHALLLSGPWPPAGWVSIVAAVLLILGGGWIFMSTLRQPSERVISPQAQPRVQ